MDNQNKKPQPPPKPGQPEKPKCPFCGRRNTVIKIEDRLYDCGYCQKTFQI
jgi:ribosomal protein L37AE/L43A